MTVYEKKNPSCPVPHPLTHHWGATFVCDGPEGCGRVWRLHNDGESFIGWIPQWEWWWKRKQYTTHNPPQYKPT